MPDLISLPRSAKREHPETVWIALKLHFVPGFHRNDGVLDNDRAVHTVKVNEVLP
jgi:hypothetical protein